MLINKKWKEVKVEVFSCEENDQVKNITGQFIKTDLDDIIVFSSGGTYSFDEGETKARTNNAQIFESGYWQLTEEADSLLLITETSTTNYFVEELSPEKLVLNLPIADEDYYYTLTYRTKSSLMHYQAEFTQNIDSLICQYIAENDIPSVAVGVVYRDSVLYGKRIVNGKEDRSLISDNEKSIYNIASVAKPFVATAIMILEQQDSINIKDPVVKYLPYFTVDSKSGNQITIEHLLTHTSGLPSVSSPDEYDYEDVELTDDALENHIESLASLKLNAKPGKKYGYSNVGFEVLGEVIAKVAQMPFEEYMNINLFQPLGMTKTSYLISDFKEDEIAQPHTGSPYKRTKRFPYNRQFSPSGNLFTSIKDMNNWMMFNLNDGRYQDFAPLSDSTYALLTTPRVDTKEDGFVGLGWFTKSLSNGRMVFHDGLDLGYSSLTVLFTEPKIGILILSNHQETNCNELLNKIAKSIKY
ncbi:MAG: serine hydrolase domain-containing protein [Cyclobacteriaceae bacterium]